MENKKLLNEVSRFQAIAGLKPVGSLGTPYNLNEDMEEEGMATTDTVEEEAMNEASWMELWNMISSAAIIGGSAAAAMKLLVKDAKANIVSQLKAKGEQIPDDKTLSQLANKAIKGEMDRVTGAGMAEGYEEGEMEEGL